MDISINKNFCECGCGQKCKRRFISGHNRRGTKRSLEWIEMIRNIMLTNNPMKNPDSIAKMIKFHVGKKLSNEHREKISKANKGHEVSQETKQKIREKHIGMFHTEETKKKLSEILKGKKGYWEGKTFSEKHRKNLSLTHKGKSNNFLGKRHSEESKRKMSKAQKGKIKGPCSEERKRKIGLANSGPNSAHWKGGISCEPYCDAWVDKEYKQDILKRDNYQCQNPNCNKLYKEKIAIHHINYDKKNCQPNNLITLCNSCNSRANFHRKYWKELYSGIIKR